MAEKSFAGKAGIEGRLSFHCTGYCFYFRLLSCLVFLCGRIIKDAAFLVSHQDPLIIIQFQQIQNFCDAFPGKVVQRRQGRCRSACLIRHCGLFFGKDHISGGLNGIGIEQRQQNHYKGCRQSDKLEPNTGKAFPEVSLCLFVLILQSDTPPPVS